MTPPHQHASAMYHCILIVWGARMAAGGHRLVRVEIADLVTPKIMGSENRQIPFLVQFLPVIRSIFCLRHSFFDPPKQVDFLFRKGSISKAALPFVKAFSRKISQKMAGFGHNLGQIGKEKGGDTKKGFFCVSASFLF